MVASGISGIVKYVYLTISAQSVTNIHWEIHAKTKSSAIQTIKKLFKNSCNFLSLLTQDVKKQRCINFISDTQIDVYAYV